MASGVAKSHCIAACIATVMLLGVVNAHFKIGRELNKWSDRPRLWQIQSMNREGQGRELSSEWFRRSNDKSGAEQNIEEQIHSNPAAKESEVFENVRPSFLNSRRKNGNQMKWVNGDAVA